MPNGKKGKGNNRGPQKQNNQPPPKPKPAPAPKVERRYQKMDYVRHAAPLTNYGEPVRTLIDAIYNNKPAASSTFFNHGYDKDPATNGGKIVGTVDVYIYYFPATTEEVKNHETIRNEGLLSGRRRLAARREKGGYPDYEEIWSFYATNHPREEVGLRTNVYGNWTPIDPSR